MIQRVLATMAFAAATSVVAHISLAGAQTAAPPATISDPVASSVAPTPPPPAAADRATSPPAAAPANPPVETASAPPAGAAPPASAALAEAVPAAAAPTPPSGPLVAYVKHTKPPQLTDMTVASAEFGLIGGLAAIAAGHDIVVKNGIEDPSIGMAHAIARAYAAAHGGQLADSPLSDDHEWTRVKASALAEQSGGAQYVVDVDPPGMDLIYFSLDWSHRDLLFLDSARVIDVSNGKVAAQARCFVRTKHTPDLKSHDELLADNAAGLKQLIARKSETCLAILETGLHLTPPPPEPPTR